MSNNKPRMRYMSPGPAGRSRDTLSPIRSTEFWDQLRSGPAVRNHRRNTRGSRGARHHFSTPKRSKESPKTDDNRGKKKSESREKSSPAENENIKNETEMETETENLNDHLSVSSFSEGSLNDSRSEIFESNGRHNDDNNEKSFGNGDVKLEPTDDLSLVENMKRMRDCLNEKTNNYCDQSAAIKEEVVDESRENEEDKKNRSKSGSKTSKKSSRSSSRPTDGRHRASRHNDENRRKRLRSNSRSKERRIKDSEQQKQRRRQSELSAGPNRSRRRSKSREGRHSDNSRGSHRSNRIEKGHRSTSSWLTGSRLAQLRTKINRATPKNGRLSPLKVSTQSRSSNLLNECASSSYGNSNLDLKNLTEKDLVDMKFPLFDAHSPDLEIQRRFQQEMRREKESRGHNQGEKKKKGICKFHVCGYCKMGSKCYFSHDSPQLVKKKMELCLFYAGDGCIKGELCTHLHKQFPCKFHHKGGHCKYGTKCKFSHDFMNQDLEGALKRFLECSPQFKRKNTVASKTKDISPAKSEDHSEEKTNFLKSPPVVKSSPSPDPPVPLPVPPPMQMPVVFPFPAPQVPNFINLEASTQQNLSSPIFSNELAAFQLACMQAIASPTIQNPNVSYDDRNANSMFGVDDSYNGFCEANNNSIGLDKDEENSSYTGQSSSFQPDMGMSNDSEALNYAQQFSVNHDRVICHDTQCSSTSSGFRGDIDFRANNSYNDLSQMQDSSVSQEHVSVDMYSSNSFNSQSSNFSAVNLLGSQALNLNHQVLPQKPSQTAAPLSNVALATYIPLDQQCSLKDPRIENFNNDDSIYRGLLTLKSSLPNLPGILFPPAYIKFEHLIPWRLPKVLDLDPIEGISSPEPVRSNPLSDPRLVFGHFGKPSNEVGSAIKRELEQMCSTEGHKSSFNGFYPSEDVVSTKTLFSFADPTASPFL